MLHVFPDIIVDPVERVTGGCVSSGALIACLAMISASVLIAGLVVLIVLLTKRKKRRADK